VSGAEVEFFISNKPYDDDVTFKLAIAASKVLGKLNEQKRLLTFERAELERISMVAKANESGIVFPHADGKISWANDSFLNISGYSDAKVIYKTPIELCRGPLTDTNRLHSMVEAFFNRENFDLELVFYRKDGTMFWAI